MDEPRAVLANDAAVLGLLAVTLGVIFRTSRSSHPALRAFYRWVPALLLCYFVPSLYNTFGLVDAEASRLYFVASRYLLPATIVLLTLSVDLQAILRLGPKALVLFLTGTAGVVLGGPLALLLFRAVHPESVGGEGADAVWRGLTTVAGSWIGGSANQTAMKEVFAVSDGVFSAMVAVDVLVANVWMAWLLWLAGESRTLDARSGADVSALAELTRRVEEFESAHARPATLPDLVSIVAVAFGVTGLSHVVADALAPFLAAEAPQLARFSLTSSFFWLVVLATTGGLALSFTPLRRLEGAGASKLGSAMLYVLVATIGMGMDIGAVLERPWLFALGAVWIGFHGAVLLAVAKALRAPVFYFAVASQANIGGAASAPVVASAFHPSLAPVGVLLAVLGYVLGTYGGWLCGQLLRLVAPA
jgi:uncharacterized membrane protein